VRGCEARRSHLGLSHVCLSHFRLVPTQGCDARRSLPRAGGPIRASVAAYIGWHGMAWHGMAWHGMVCTGRTAYDACTLRTPHGLAGRVHASCHVERSPCVAHRRRSEPSRAQRSDHAMIIIGRGASGHQTREHLAVGHIGDAGDQDRRPRARRSVSARSYTPAGPQLPAPGRTASHDRAA
jgi:hypothetical protein